MISIIKQLFDIGCDSGMQKAQNMLPQTLTIMGKKTIQYDK
jgi:hypothetical protein